MKKKIIYVISIICFIAAAGILFLPENFFNKKNYVRYSDFLNYIENDNIQKVEFAESKIYFITKNNQSNWTNNPQSPNLYEELLKKDIIVSSKKDSSQIISIFFDLIFYIFLFIILYFAYTKVFKPNKFKIVHKTGITFKDIVGMDELKKDMQQIIQIMQNPNLYKKQGMRLPKGILLVGDPGNGKTLFAKALASEAKINFIPTKATDFESMFMAIGPLKVKMLFNKARKQRPCIIFIDEFDGIGTTRNYSGSALETENTRIVTALLNELDGFENSSGIFVIAATNSIQALDKALIRPGRFDLQFTVPYPDENARIELIKMYTKNFTLDDSADIQILSKKFQGFSCAKIESILNNASINANLNNKKTISLEDVNIAISKL